MVISATNLLVARKKNPLLTVARCDRATSGSHQVPVHKVFTMFTDFLPVAGQLNLSFVSNHCHYNYSVGTAATQAAAAPAAAGAPAGGGAAAGGAAAAGGEQQQQEQQQQQQEQQQEPQRQQQQQQPDSKKTHTAINIRQQHQRPLQKQAPEAAPVLEVRTPT